MQYTKVIFDYHFPSDVEEALFLQGLADLGFDSFLDNEAYIPSANLDETALRHYAEDGAQTILAIEACPDENWNATWEAEHPVEELPLGVRIIPHCAFGAGHHETTGMMIQALLQLSETTPLCGMHVLDQGCGTGVLGIFAARLGADVVAVDIDDKSVENTLENASLNRVTLDARLGSEVPTGQYDLILANIHRNILLGMMADFAACTHPGSRLWLSGFYEQDCQTLIDSAKEHGFCHIATLSDNEWRLLQFKK